MLRHTNQEWIQYNFQYNGFYFFLKTYYHNVNGTNGNGDGCFLFIKRFILAGQQNKIFHYCFIMLKEIRCNTRTFYITENTKYFGMPGFRFDGRPKIGMSEPIDRVEWGLPTVEWEQWIEVQELWFRIGLPNTLPQMSWKRVQIVISVAIIWQIASIETWSAQHSPPTFINIQQQNAYFLVVVFFSPNVFPLWLLLYRARANEQESSSSSSV